MAAEMATLSTIAYMRWASTALPNIIPTATALTHGEPLRSASVRIGPRTLATASPCKAIFMTKAPVTASRLLLIIRRTTQFGMELHCFREEIFLDAGRELWGKEKI